MMKQASQNKVLRYGWLTLFLLTTALIIYFAAQPASISSEQSGFFVNTIVGILSWFGYVPSDPELANIAYLVRKLIGHFGLFMANGLFGYMAAFGWLKLKQSWKYLLISITASILLAIGSETIQLFVSGRAGAFDDVMINMAGAMMGITFVYWLTNRIQGVKKI